MKRPALTEPQAQAVPYAITNPYSILALDPGLGKSRVLIEVREKLKNNCLIICPSYLISNWVKEIKLWAGDNANITTFRKGKDIYDVCDSDYVVTSYDLVQKSEHLFEWADMIGIDEAHAIKSMKAKRSQFIHKNIFENSVPRVHLLTGTPIKNRVQEFYSLLALCFYNPNIADTQFLNLYPSEIDFADQFSFRESYDMELPDGRRIPIVKWSGLRNVDDLKMWLKGKYLRIKSTGADTLYKSFHVSETNDEKLLNSFTSFFLDEDEARAARVDREERTGSVMPEHKAVAALKKAPFTVKYAKDLLEQVDCCLIYTDHVKACEEIAKEFNVPALHGGVPAKRRAEIAREFQEGKGNVLVATIGALSTGVDLFRSSHIIFNDYPWVPGDLKQAIHRIERLGQKKQCTVHRIVGSPQDGYIMDVIEEKINTIDKAT